MNERIRELIKQATSVELGVDNGFDMVIFDKEKFAELIVFDVLHICLMMQHGNQYTPEELLFQTKYRKIVREHFGVDQ